MTSTWLAGKGSQMFITLFVWLMSLGTVTENPNTEFPVQTICLSFVITPGATGLDGHIFYIPFLG